MAEEKKGDLKPSETNPSLPHNGEGQQKTAARRRRRRRPRKKVQKPLSLPEQHSQSSPSKPLVEKPPITSSDEGSLPVTEPPLSLEPSIAPSNFSSEVSDSASSQPSPVPLSAEPGIISEPAVIHDNDTPPSENSTPSMGDNENIPPDVVPTSLPDASVEPALPSGNEPVDQSHSETPPAIEPDAPFEPDTTSEPEVVSPEPNIEYVYQNSEPEQQASVMPLEASSESLDMYEDSSNVPPDRSSVVDSETSSDSESSTTPQESSMGTDSTDPAENLLRRFVEVFKKIFIIMRRFFVLLFSLLQIVFQRFFSVFTFILRPRLLMTLLLLGGLIFGGYFVINQNLPGKIYTSLLTFFTPKPAPLVTSPLSQQELSGFGIATVMLFSSNQGSFEDRLPPEIQAVTFFGELKEPKLPGETGITALIYYGELRDEAADFNEYVEYVRNLEELQNLYKINVYEMLDQTEDRASALLKYLEQLYQAKTKSETIVRRMGLNLDELKISYNSLSSDRSKYEADYFTSLEQLKAEKSDAILKSFIDIAEKQTALKARVNALSKLLQYYNTALQRLSKRIEAIEKNRGALIQGIHVIDVPGGNIDIIIKP